MKLEQNDMKRNWMNTRQAIGNIFTATKSFGRIRPLLAILLTTAFCVSAALVAQSVHASGSNASVFSLVKTFFSGRTQASERSSNAPETATQPVALAPLFVPFLSGSP